MNRYDTGWYRAAALAVALINDNTVLAQDLYNEMGLTKKRMEEAGVDEGDIERIKEAFGPKWETVA